MAVASLLKSNMKKTPYCQNAGMPSIPVGLGLFSMA